jgi:hypothetical protein
MMINHKAKGSRKEHRTMQLLEAGALLERGSYLPRIRYTAKYGKASHVERRNAKLIKRVL